jgi:flap endonuclease-1
MGIKQLNHFLMENCTTKSIYKVSLKQFANKTIVIDTSIYLYKFAEKNAVAENMYLMISVFRQYNIVPVFVFDGKPPIEKKALLIKRKIEKDAAEVKYNELKSAMDSGEYTTATVTAALTEMDTLKKQFIRVSEKDIAKSKEIMRAYGVPYIESKGESDHLCAFLVKHGFAWACLSDDMDMFLYGCPRVIRHLSLLHHEGVLYDTAQILVDLDMTQEVFNDIAILSGTDYNMTTVHKSLSDTLRLYMRYREWSHNNTKITQTKPFYEWMVETTDYVDNKDSLQHIRKMFDLNLYLENNREEFKRVVDTMPFEFGVAKLDELKTALFDDGFIFC